VTLQAAESAHVGGSLISCQLVRLW